MPGPNDQAEAQRKAVFFADQRRRDFNAAQEGDPRARAEYERIAQKLSQGPRQLDIQRLDPVGSPQIDPMGPQKRAQGMAEGIVDAGVAMEGGGAMSTLIKNAPRIGAMLVKQGLPNTARMLVAEARNALIGGGSPAGPISKAVGAGTRAAARTAGRMSRRGAFSNARPAAKAVVKDRDAVEGVKYHPDSSVKGVKYNTKGNRSPRDVKASESKPAPKSAPSRAQGAAKKTALSKTQSVKKAASKPSSTIKSTFTKGGKTVRTKMESKTFGSIKKSPTKRTPMQSRKPKGVVSAKGRQAASPRYGENVRSSSPGGKRIQTQAKKTNTSAPARKKNTSARKKKK